MAQETNQAAQMKSIREQRSSLTGVTQRSHSAEMVALGALCLGYFMVILDATIVNVVAPVLQTQLGTTHTAVQWVIDGYLLAFASLLLTAGGLGVWEIRGCFCLVCWSLQRPRSSVAWRLRLVC